MYISCVSSQIVANISESFFPFPNSSLSLKLVGGGGGGGGGWQ